ncbi:type III-B CRISPR module-associated protein Cmr3 [Paenibacillus sp. GCM10012307]|uniref:Type III-B CRISPR module-associated protein Cmr3 n=1 Tax=Paenibacillus roseus TaxID=2798579 RepID=A0A934MMZ9_9BACL|nr:type III-B CRISPR module-associated protein Cmr3 [Paenibacillus roseus]MBJ6363925.1 type III-B CRISPR module-associated protein Cmr3 [Paenibacillus roseus]
MNKTIRIQPLEPILIRDGRPFGDTPGAAAHSTGTIFPSVVAGTLRTLIGKQVSGPMTTSSIFKTNKMDAIKKSVVRGPLYLLGDRIFFPFPQDLDVYESEEGAIQVSFRRPRQLTHSGQGFLGTDKEGRYSELLWPVAEASIRKLWTGKPAFVSSEWMNQWLLDELTPVDWERELEKWKEASRNGNSTSDSHFLASFKREVRVHTAIDAKTYAAHDKKLFSTEMLILPDGMSLLVELDDQVMALKELHQPISTLHSLGGKRRLAHFSQDVQNDYWRYPDALQNGKLHSKTLYIRMVLVTPAYFSRGWLPKWLDENLETDDTFSPHVKLRLCWACIPRSEPVSGWSYKEERPKAVRRMVPAGSVYFFKVESGNPEALVRELWLKSVSDINRRKVAVDKEDGFGLAVWGTWTPASSTGEGEKRDEEQ